MLKKTITFKDLDGNSLTEDFYFSVSKAELAEMEIGETKNGGMAAVIQQIIDETDGKKITTLLNNVIKLAYGERSSDNRRFIKSEEAWENFYYTDAHSELLYELYTDAGKAAEFMNGIVPTEVAEKMPDADGVSAEEIRKTAMESMQGHKPKQD